MIDGVILGFIMWLSLVFTFMHIPKILKSFFLKHFLITDILSSVITFLLLTGISQSLVAVVGSVTTGLLVNMTLMTYNKIGLKIS